MRRIQTIKATSVILALILTLGIAVGQANAQHQREINQTISGSTNFVYRPTGDEEIRALGICAGTGTFGSFTCQTLTLIPPGDSPPLGFDTANCPDRYEFELPATAGHVQRFANGQVLYWRRDNSAEAKNFYCVDPSLPTEAYIVQTYEYVGGSGRFEGATGKVVMKITNDLIHADANGMSAVYGSHGVIKGTINLVGRGHRTGGTGGDQQATSQYPR